MGEPCPKPGGSTQSKRQRAKVRARSDAKAAYRASRPETCEVCGKGNRALHVHHKKLLSQGGTDTFDNFSLECEECHGGDHHLKVKIDEQPMWSKG